MFHTAMAIGRFQGLHLGHVGLIKSMMGLASRSIVFVGSAQESGTARNPFTHQIRTTMLEMVFEDEVASGRVRFVPLPDMTDESDICHAWGRYLIAETVRVTGRLPDLTVYGKEPSHDLWYCQEDDSRMATLAIPRDMFLDVSATDLRWYVANGDFRTYSRVTPPEIHGLFDTLRETLFGIQYYRNLVSNRGIELGETTCK